VRQRWRPTGTWEPQLVGRNQLETLDERQARIVEMRFFGGLDVGEVAHSLGISERTVKREWQKARAFLFNALRTS
jgi:RNA polymerase sigma factor (sigma-70 family)